jgi:hypothetical protein
MEWQVQEKIDSKVKAISDKFQGDGSAFAKQQYFYVLKWSNNKVSFEKRMSFWKMSDAYTWFIQYVTFSLKREADADFLLVGNNMPLLSTAAWNSDITKLLSGRAIAEGTISLKSFYDGQAQ